ncbi:MAG: DUF1343 domain-containing protein [Bacteroidetes bacterium]|nr:DUF1343 domain-containing protein [Bacteroidota bacterium]MBP6315531.1 DUF1343 domain-containing protein [Chitinophagaceae bacterium]
MLKIVLLMGIVLQSYFLNAQTFSNKVIVGAEQMDSYISSLKNKKVALLVNQTSTVKDRHLVDTLLASKINIVKIFAPEHGFRGTADAGEKIKSGIDTKTGIPISSMYGANKKPSAVSMKGIDVVVFDIQDVGVRFYTYISSLQYMMEACAQAKIPLVILDRPNPNGFYVDGPIMEAKNKSFVGMQPIPIVHGMTVGEYAQMLNGEKWLTGKMTCKLKVIPCLHYDHNTLYNLPIPPSPNLKSATAVFLYPSLCLFEGTCVSVGRGTETPFEVWGAPMFKDNGFSFIPKSTEGAKRPLYENQVCHGANLRLPPYDVLKIIRKKLHLTFVKNAYSLMPDKTKFFNDFFEKLTGNVWVRYHIMQNKSDEDMRASWEPGLTKFKKVRKKYLLYPDFE